MLLFDVKPVLSYQQCSSKAGLCNVRFVLKDGYVWPRAAGGDDACQMEVAIALYHGVLRRQAQRSPWDLGRGSVFFQLGFPWHGFLSFIFSLLLLFVFSHLLSHPFLSVSSFPLSFLPPFFSLSSFLCDSGFVFSKVFKLKVITCLLVGTPFHIA